MKTFVRNFHINYVMMTDEGQVWHFYIEDEDTAYAHRIDGGVLGSVEQGVSVEAGPKSTDDIFVTYVEQTGKSGVVQKFKASENRWLPPLVGGLVV